MSSFTEDPERGNAVDRTNIEAAAAPAEIKIDDATNNNNADHDKEEEEEEEGISLEEIIYAAASYSAVLKPVSITMILASLAVMYINTEETKAAGEQALDQSYQVFTISDDQSAATSLGLGLVNSLIIVCVIGGMTFFIVLLYKYKCMKLLIGYMIVASTMLLGFLGGQMFNVAIDKYALPIDQISFYFTMYNFAIVGVLAVFYQKGIPTCINQGYLVATSVIVAWQLSYFNAWMAWTLLVMLALYDLFAVLTPCGPLKALVKLMSKDDAPSMPGLLYEAQLPVARPGRKKENNNNASGQNDESSEVQQDITESRGIEMVENCGGEKQNSEEARIDGTIAETWQTDGSQENFTVGNANAAAINNTYEANRQSPVEGVAPKPKSKSKRSSRRKEGTGQTVQSESRAPVSSATTQVDDAASGTIMIPLAIAKVYKLPLVSPESITGLSIDISSPRAYVQQEFSATELQTEVKAKLPRGGGRIETTHSKKGEARYTIYDRNGEVKRTLTVAKDGKVMEVIKGSDDEGSGLGDNNIKLGLGDFIFYSVLVSKAAENGFASWLSCFLSTLAGLGGTLVLLSVYHKALPALPISIFLAVTMFVLTIYCMEPWIQDLWRLGPLYV